MSFTGKERDSESGNDYFGARYYASLMGRWLSPDPINLTNARAMNPANTLNKYVYGANNPLKYVDPDGKDITIYYRAPSGGATDFGHVMLGVLNQDTGKTAFIDYYPAHGTDWKGDGPGTFNPGGMAERGQQNANDLYVNSGDAHTRQLVDCDKLFRYGKHVDSSLLTALATADLPENYLPLTVPAIFGEAALRAEPRGASPLLKDVWLPQTALMAARTKENSDKGLYLACIASDNGKSHSHNDTGSFWVYLNGEPVIIDLGSESYQKQSFDEHRYELASTQSAYHNLPTIGTIQQGVGSAYRATHLRYQSNDSDASLEMNLTEAYPPEAGLREWIRNVALDRNANQIVIRDRFAFRSNAAQITWSLMTCCHAILEDGSVRFKPAPVTWPLMTWTSGEWHPEPRAPDATDPSSEVVLDYNAALLTAEVETINLTNPGLVMSWGPQVRRVLLRNRLAMEGESRLLIRPRSA